MRLFEVDQGSAREVLAVLKGLANKPGSNQASELPWPVVQNILKGFGISTPDGVIALKNQVDSQGAVIQDVKPDGSIVLNTNVKDPNDQPEATPRSTGPSVDQMAKANSKLGPKI